MKPAIFLDRDGVINREVNYLHKIEDFEWTERCIEALQNLQNKGYPLFIVTNQAGIGRGFYSEQDYQALTDWYLNELEQQGVHITAVEYCPHHPREAQGAYRQDCDCRKPKPGMLLSLIQQHQLDPAQSIMVGDKLSDMQAGYAAGIGRCVLVESGHKLPDKVDAEVYANLYEFSVAFGANP